MAIVLYISSHLHQNLYHALATVLGLNARSCIAGKILTNLLSYVQNAGKMTTTPVIVKMSKVAQPAKKPGHEPGSSVCAKFVADPKNVATVQGAKHVLSNFYPCDLKIFGENFKSAEQAYQLTKAIRTGNLVAADKIRDAKSALECKLIGNTVTNTPQ